ncbi:MAG: hypothetical protein A2X52_01330 [Candidatus Rokubacteria bacterium GWC2_70_16]|nr:MAG: hypothetical protein A2X52_01330 [Candidatus Rokubacteria bacterium GWC2_70_16]OGL16259.1 MAG: hypothetical protein A3K12_05175 [Candidatus Rokubacteria bacterium RIFCSPLOWO2_12_FULL_71_19]
MRVQVQLFATLSAYLPAAAGGEGVTLVLDEGATVGQVMQSLQIPLDLPCLTVVNGRDAAPGQVLAEGDVLTMFPPLAGG